jgi:biotin transport system substrate-specific component
MIQTQAMQRAWAHPLIRNMVLATAGALLLGILAQLPPLHVYNWVPITLQTLGVLCLGAFMGPQLAAAAVAEYVLLGLTGVPWFANFTAGPLVLAGPTGGYLLAFPVAAWVSGWLYQRLVTGRYLLRLAGGLVAGALGAMLILLGGAAWLSVFFMGDWHKALLVGFMPFVLVDTLKAAVVATLVAQRK